MNFQDIREEQLSNMTRQLNVKRFSPYFAYYRRYSSWL